MSDERPDETEAERADRNFVDLLQEMRVAQTGVQILFAFLLTMPLQSKFDELDRTEIGLFLAALLLSAAASVFLIAPVAIHRVLFQRRMKSEVVQVASRCTMAGLACLALAVVSAVGLVLDLVLTRPVAATVAGVLLAGILVLWLAIPMYLRDERDEH